MTTHHTAWLTTDRTYLETDRAEVDVIPDSNIGTDDNPVWTASGDPVYWASLTAHHSDRDDAMRAAACTLTAAGWAIRGPWKTIPSGCVATVVKDTP
jgi:hypothetical protein